VPKSVEVICVHFLNRSLWRPSIECNPVYGNKDPASVPTQPAMDENSPTGSYLNNPEKIGNLSV
jgi:hypothetical protein